jgi:ubiquinone/menaquinone biosynthesis C-methylase UbiE
MRARMPGFSLPAMLLLAALPTILVARDKYQDETARLASLMHWTKGDVIADIGAGEGQMSFDAAKRVGPTGHVYTTELDDHKLANLKNETAQNHIQNVTILKAGTEDTNLPANCCNSIFMRRVYHHFTHPKAIDAALFRDLKAGGMLALIDFPPNKWLPAVAGVPANRGGHGIPEDVMTDELKAAGFEIVSVQRDWPEDDYFVLARKPSH